MTNVSEIMHGIICQYRSNCQDRKCLADVSWYAASVYCDYFTEPPLERKKREPSMKRIMKRTLGDYMDIIPEARPRVMKTNIKNITKHVADRISEMGFYVAISCSNKSKSRYLEIILSEERKLNVRVSDHPLEKSNRWRYKFDIHTTVRRRGSVDYIEFLDAFKQVIGETEKDSA